MDFIELGSIVIVDVFIYCKYLGNQQHSREQNVGNRFVSCPHT